MIGFSLKRTAFGGAMGEKAKPASPAGLTVKNSFLVTIYCSGFLHKYASYRVSFNNLALPACISAKIFIDAGYQADLMSRVGVSSTFGLAEF